MVRTVSTSETRLLRDPRPRPRARRPCQAPPPTAAAAAEALGFRTMGAEDLPWVQAWTAQLGLPGPRTTRVRSFILTEEGRRVGYLAARATAFNTGQGREPVMWICAAYLIPSHRGRGLLPRFCEKLSAAHYGSGTAVARVAADNATMHRFMARGGWRKIRATQRFTDYALALTRPFRARAGG
ncbi:GNAT family N-acetyltransferase [Roseospira navarrensis]|uniref:N-acetyltransferase domain-containing protein n=1 Tax=Roseospira navarrensis TaxID=140058 RepID=A0A7X1ZFK2_9PROT|nr:GNAT family N-acetyltransferase [Roseospira navarrensis]MQX37640.1 hypothetical protein [Roseospira navarrensis]